MSQSPRIFNVGDRVVPTPFLRHVHEGWGEDLARGIIRDGGLEITERIRLSDLPLEGQKRIQARRPDLPLTTFIYTIEGRQSLQDNVVTPDEASVIVDDPYKWFCSPYTRNAYGLP